MDTMFYLENLVDQASITASNPNALFPASNLLDDRRTKVTRSTTNSDNIVFDFQQTEVIDSIFIVENKLSGLGINSLTLQLNGSDSWGSPAFSQVVTLQSNNGLGYQEFANQSYRYARIVLGSTLGYCEVSKLFIGAKTDVGRCHSIGWSFKEENLSRQVSNRYGQKFIDTITKQKTLNISYQLLDKDMVDKIFNIYDQKSTTKPFYFRTSNDTISNNKDRFAGMFYLKDEPTITNTSFGRYGVSLQLVEAM